MADLTIAQLPLKSEALEATDKVLYWDGSVSVNNTKAVTIADLKSSLNAIENFPTGSGIETVAGTTTAGAGASLSLSKNVSLLTTTTGNAKFNLAAPVNGYGDIKEIVFIGTTGDNPILSLGSGVHKPTSSGGSVTFTGAGASLILKSYNGKWAIIGQYNVVMS